MKNPFKRKNKDAIPPEIRGGGLTETEIKKLQLRLADIEKSYAKVSSRLLEEINLRKHYEKLYRRYEPSRAAYQEALKVIGKQELEIKGLTDMIGQDKIDAGALEYLRNNRATGNDPH